jgi:hypothetical protein
MALVKPTLALCSLLLLGSTASGTEIADGPEAAELEAVRTCVEASTPRTSTVQKLVLTVEEDGEESLRSRLTLYWRKLHDGRRRIVLRFREPEDLAQAGLHIEARPGARPRVHIYLPGQGKPRRVKSGGELEGFLGRANLGIDELALLLEPLAERDASLLEKDADLDGRSVWVLEEHPPADDEDSRFRRTVIFVDQEFCIPLRAEFYDRDGTTTKVLDVDPSTVTRVVGSWIPRLLVFRDLPSKIDTIMRIEEVEVDVPLSPALLTVEALPKLSR